MEHFYAAIFRADDFSGINKESTFSKNFLQQETSPFYLCHFIQIASFVVARRRRKRNLISLVIKVCFRMSFCFIYFYKSLVLQFFKRRTVVRFQYFFNSVYFIFCLGFRNTMFPLFKQSFHHILFSGYLGFFVFRKIFFVLLDF